MRTNFFLLLFPGVSPWDLPVQEGSSSTLSWQAFTLKLFKQGGRQVFRRPKIVSVRQNFCGNLWFSYGHLTRKIGYAFLATTFFAVTKLILIWIIGMEAMTRMDLTSLNKANLLLLQQWLYCLVARHVSYSIINDWTFSLKIYFKNKYV